MPKKRLPSTRLSINDIQNGFYRESEGEFEPNYLLTRNAKRVYRAKVVGTVVEDPFFNDNEDYANVRIDDGTEVLRVVGFRDDIKFFRNLKRGDMIQTIGKIKEWEGKKQMNIEALHKIDDYNLWLMHRSKVLKSKLSQLMILDKGKQVYKEHMNSREGRKKLEERGIDPQILDSIDELKELEKEEEKVEVEEEKEEETEVKEVKPVKDAILEYLEGKDSTPREEIVQDLNENYPEHEVEDAITDLLIDGEIIEPKIDELKLI